MENPKEITLPFEEYEKLLERELILSFLLDAGVDNWDGYEDAMESYHKFLNYGQD